MLGRAELKEIHWLKNTDKRLEGGERGTNWGDLEIQRDRESCESSPSSSRCTAAHHLTSRRVWSCASALGGPSVFLRYCWPHFAPWSTPGGPKLQPRSCDFFFLFFFSPPRFGSMAAGSEPGAVKTNLSIWKDRVCLIGVTEARSRVRAAWSKLVTKHSTWWIASACPHCSETELPFPLWNYDFLFCTFPETIQSVRREPTPIITSQFHLCLPTFIWNPHICDETLTLWNYVSYRPMGQAAASPH